MADRYLCEATNPVNVPIATGKAVATGDPVGLASGTLVTAADETWDTNLATTQTNFANRCVGRSAQTKAAGVARATGNSLDNVVRCDTSGQFENDLAAPATVAFGAFLAPAKHPSNNALVNDKVVVVGSKALACFVCTETTPANATKVKYRLIPKANPVSG